MNKSTLRIIAWGCVCLSVLLAPAAAQETETVEGVTVVSNGLKPTPPPGQPATFKLVEELTFGLGGNPNESFSSVAGFAVDSDGTVFALDNKDCAVKVFDSSGKFLRRIGGPGQGPGEFKYPYNILLSGDGRLLVNDPISQKLSIFKPWGEHVEDIPTFGRMRLNIRAVDARGNFLGTENRFIPDSPTMFYELKKYGPGLDILFLLDSIEFSADKLDYPGIGFGQGFDQSGNIYFGRRTAYEIKVLSPEGKHLRTIRKDYEPKKLTRQDIDDMLEEMGGGPAGKPDESGFNFREFYPPFQDFLLDDEGRLFVRTYTKGKTKGEWIVDVFDPEGRFIAQFATRAELKIIRGGKAYGLEETDDGFEVIKRYALTQK